MRSSAIATATFFLAVALVVFPSVIQARQTATPKRILLLYWNDRDYAGNIAFEQSFRAPLQSAPPGSVEYYSEYLESTRFPGEKQSLLLRDYLRTKYADRNIDVIMAVTDQPLTFLLKYRQEPLSTIRNIWSRIGSPERSNHYCCAIICGRSTPTAILM